MKHLLSLFAAVLVASAASSQTTHTVAVGPTFSFGPADITITVGDTVRWEWSGGFSHNVESGVGGVPDGIFSSGMPTTAPDGFSLTFDSAFLSANPVPGNAYDYYCIVHVAFTGMAGVVRVIEPYACLNPSGSLVTLAGAPVTGGTWTIGVNNPLPGAQTPGASLAFLGIATKPQPNFPCGLPLPGFHMDPTSPLGEILIGIAPPNPIVSAGPVVWAGPATPAAFPIPIPPNPLLVGIELYAQGLILDPVGPNTWGASQGLKASIGS